jgi:hypothetical protein
LLLALGPATASAPPADPSSEPHPLVVVKARPLEARLDAFSRLFLGRPYTFHSALGEGPSGRFDQNPLERFDTFHCVTYLETVVALALARDEADFRDVLRRLRYRRGEIAFEKRNHFPCLDWIPNNVANGVFRDVTERVAGPGNTAVARAQVDRKAWYRFMGPDRLVLPDADDATRQERLDELRRLGDGFRPVRASLRYIPLHVLFPQPPATMESPLDATVPENTAIFDRIPNGAVVSIVRPNWNVLKVIGTRMNVSHQGFLFRVNGVLHLRHAKREVGRKVTQEPFVDYLRRAIAFKTIGGIHLLEVIGRPRP